MKNIPIENDFPLSYWLSCLLQSSTAMGTYYVLAYINSFSSNKNIDSLIAAADRHLLLFTARLVAQLWFGWSLVGTYIKLYELYGKEE